MNHKLPLTLGVLLCLGGCTLESLPTSSALNNDLLVDMSRSPTAQGARTMTVSNTLDMVVSPQEDMSMSPKPDMAMTALDMAAVEVDMAPVVPLRTLTPYKMMGKIPLNNQVLDPTFDNLNVTDDWVVVGPAGYQHAWRHVGKKSPMNAPSMLISRENGPTDATVYGDVIFPASTDMTASVWVGQKASKSRSTVKVSIIGFDHKTPATPGKVILAKSEGSNVTLDGIEWVKHEGSLRQFIGYGYFSVSDNSAQDVYLHAPVVLPAVRTLSDFDADQRIPSAINSPWSPDEKHNYELMLTLRKHAETLDMFK